MAYTTTKEEENFREQEKKYDKYHYRAGWLLLFFIVMTFVVAVSLFLFSGEEKLNGRLGLSSFIMILALGLYIGYFSNELLKLRAEQKMQDILSKSLGLGHKHTKWAFRYTKLKYEILAIQTFAVILFTYFMIMTYKTNNKRRINGWTRFVTLIPTLCIAVYGSIKFDQDWRNEKMIKS